MNEYILALDISTKTIGVTILNTSGALVDIFYISLPKATKKTGAVTIYDKADYFKEAISKYQHFNIKYIYIEEPLKNGPNISTTIILAKFNGIVSQALYEMFKVVPEHITVHEARKIFFPEYIRVDKKKDQVLSIPKDIDKKKLVLDKVSWLEPSIIWEYNKSKLKEENYDRADSYVIALVGLYINNFINNIPKRVL